MISPSVSILLPHLRNAENNAAVRIALDTLATHTDVDYELMLEAVEARRDIYAVINRMARRALGEWLIFWNSDVFASPNWIRPLLDSRDVMTIVSPTMVECGAIPVSDRNLERDFGRTPYTFRRSEFEQFVADGGAWKPEWDTNACAWFWPSLINRRVFLEMGGYDTSRGQFPDPLDRYFWDHWEQNGGSFKRVPSFVYHLQAFSDGERPDAHR